MEQSSLSMLFGVPPSTLSRILRRAEEALSKALHGYAPARISWPSPTRQAELAKLVEAREPLLKYTFGFIDGKNFKTFKMRCIMDGSILFLRQELFASQPTAALSGADTTARGDGMTRTRRSASE
ncbi:hypothetical protein PR002_g7260 [Phytophthora rubi]|uniref:DDE Tnp4 domain-containing protein n=1 Tax=Phytophthora rubi TaxID=129364 RepID=A0A6A3MSE5_9STRA|nr:hypothetical protein PR002_g7260 [Phytophthora rubi]